MFPSVSEITLKTWANIAKSNPKLTASEITVCKIRGHGDVIQWKHFPRYWPFVRGSTGHRRIPLTKADDAEL